MLEFVEFPKMARLSRRCVITEKIDGTNAQILIEAQERAHYNNPRGVPTWAPVDGDWIFLVHAGSRNRFVTPDNDNFGFAAWAYAHIDEVVKLGPGRHYGEWWGSGIQRGYGLTKGEKRFSLFNTERWCAHDAVPMQIPTGDPRIQKWQTPVPSCMGVVPVLYDGEFTTTAAEQCIERLRANGSVASPGFMKPEGIVVYHTAGNVGFKKTLDKDEVPKSKA